MAHHKSHGSHGHHGHHGAKYREDPRVPPSVGGPTRKGRKLAEIEYLKKKGKHLSHHQKKFIEHEKRAAKRAEKSDWASRKIESGKKYGRLQRFPTLSDDQKKILKDYMKPIKSEKFKEPRLMSSALDFLQRGIEQGVPVSPVEASGRNFLQNLLGGPAEEMARSYEAPYLREFREDIAPGIAERFAGADALRGSGFQNAMMGAGAGLTENLAQVKSNLINQLLNQQMQGANLGLGYAQLPSQRYAQQLQTAQLGIPSSMIPQNVQQEMNRYAQNLNFQRQQAVLGTQPFGYMAVSPRAKSPGFWGGGGGRMIGGAIQGGIMGGMAGGPMGALAGAGAGALGGALGAPPPSISIGAPQPVPAGGAPQRMMMPPVSNL